MSSLRPEPQRAEDAFTIQTRTRGDRNGLIVGVVLLAMAVALFASTRSTSIRVLAGVWVLLIVRGLVRNWQRYRRTGPASQLVVTGDGIQLFALGFLPWKDIDHVGIWRRGGQPCASIWLRDGAAIRRQGSPMLRLMLRKRGGLGRPDVVMPQRLLAPYDPQTVVEEISRRAGGRVTVTAEPVT
jgi:hypothetical protein